MSRSTFSAAYTNASDATYTAWAYGLSQALDACGFFPKTADPQPDWTPDRTAPSGVNTFPDSEIRYLDDALHGTQPLYVKLDYGEAAVTNMPGMRVTFSLFPTNGAGSFTNGVSYGPYSIGPSAGAISASSFSSYVSGGEGYVNFCLFPGVTGNNGTALSISRLVNSAGAFTADGFHIVNAGSISTLAAYSRFQATLLAANNQIRGPFGTYASNQPATGTGAYAGNLGVYPIFPAGPGFPNEAVLQAFLTDIGPSGVVISVEVNGAAHDYIIAAHPLANNSANTLVNLLRY